MKRESGDMRYKLIVIGGSFDRLHKGHRHFLSASFGFSERVIIGLTSDRYLREVKRVEDFFSFERRKKELLDFVKSIGREDDVTIRKLERNEIPEDLQNKVEAIAVTEDTIVGAASVNEARFLKGLPPLPIIEIPLVKDATGLKISSSRIRAGQAYEEDGDSSGFMPSGDLLLTEALRIQLKKPFGKLYKSVSYIDKTDKLIVSVGDVTTKSLLSLKITPWVSVIDFVVERKKIFSDISDFGFYEPYTFYTVKNPPSTLSRNLFAVLGSTLSNTLDKSVIFIQGEEDLAVLPAVILAPLGTAIYYGQPDEGVVRVVVDYEMKEKARKIISNFSTGG